MHKSRIKFYNRAQLNTTNSAQSILATMIEQNTSKYNVLHITFVHSEF